MAIRPIVVVGAGVAGLVAAIELAGRGLPVVVLERTGQSGGKIAARRVAGRSIDVGPTVFTMRWVFESIFARAGTSLAERLSLSPLEILARHAWGREQRLDLFADQDRSALAITEFAGASEARGYRRFCRRSAEIFETLRQPFMEQSCSSPIALMRQVGITGLPALARISPFRTMHNALTDYFRDPRLLQLFGRYATYCGSSPYLAPATLMLIAHVEQCGVWSVEGGMVALAAALENLARERGVEFRYHSNVSEVVVENGTATAVVTSDGELLFARAVIANCDSQAIAHGRLGAAASSAVQKTVPAERSLSAVTWAMVANTAGFPLLRHNVFFSPDYANEFAQIMQHGKVPSHPTVYVCAQDRLDLEPDLAQPERLFCLINAPASGDHRPLSDAELEQCLMHTIQQLEQAGLQLELDRNQVHRSDPSTFEAQFPATGGALYGRASHGWNASFQRPAATTSIGNLYLAGGSVHPGPGVPMAAQSGILAAQMLLRDQGLGESSNLTGTAGGISMR